MTTTKISVPVFLDNLRLTDDPSTLWDSTNKFTDAIPTWRSVFEPQSLEDLMNLELTLDNTMREMESPYSYEQSDGSRFNYRPRHSIIKDCLIYTHSLDRPIVQGLREYEYAGNRLCNVKGWIRSRDDGNLNLSLDYVNFYPPEVEEDIEEACTTEPDYDF